MDIQIFNNGGETYDRYCLIIDNSKVYTVAADSQSFQDVKYLCDAVDLDREAAGKLVDFKDLPAGLMRLISVDGTRLFEKIYGHMNKRSDQRLNCEASIAFSFFGKGRTYEGRMLNFSKSGMYFESGKFIKGGTAIHSRLTNYSGLPSGPELCEGLRSISIAEVKWCREMKNKEATCFGIGVKYY